MNALSRTHSLGNGWSDVTHESSLSRTETDREIAKHAVTDGRLRSDEFNLIHDRQLQSTKAMPDTQDEGRKVGLIPHGSARVPLG